MSWEYSVSKKYSNTSHFRLLKQIKSDLKPSQINNRNLDKNQENLRDKLIN